MSPRWRDMRKYLYDMNGEAVARGKAAIEKDLRFLVGKGAKLAEADCEAALARVLPVTKLSDARDAGLAIEAIVEKLETKQELFAQLEALLGEDAILASNTSSLSITAMAAPLAGRSDCWACTSSTPRRA